MGPESKKIRKDKKFRRIIVLGEGPGRPTSPGRLGPENKKMRNQKTIGKIGVINW